VDDVLVPQLVVEGASGHGWSAENNTPLSCRSVPEPWRGVFEDRRRVDVEPPKSKILAESRDFLPISNKMVGCAGS